MEKHKTCSFIGHRKIVLTEELVDNLKQIIVDLVTNKNVSVFLFGSRSEFNTLCHTIVSSLKEKFTKTKCIFYTCKSECCLLEKDKTELKNILENLKGLTNDLLFFDEEFEHTKKYSSSKASYVERNQALINDSDYCVFYYDKNYLPVSKKNLVSKSGTAIAYEYAKQRKKNIINVFIKIKN